MAGDKLNRVKSVRKWLDKAEQSYSRDKEISGEINLIMAQAEMQRLKENYPHKQVKKWSIRVGAFALAVGIMFGIIIICGRAVIVISQAGCDTD